MQAWRTQWWVSPGRASTQIRQELFHTVSRTPHNALLVLDINNVHEDVFSSVLWYVLAQEPSYIFKYLVQQPRLVTPDFRMWESSRSKPLTGGFSRGSPVLLPLHSSAAPYSPRFTLIGSHDLDTYIYEGAAVAEWLDCSSLTRTNRVRFPTELLLDFHIISQTIKDAVLQCIFHRGTSGGWDPLRGNFLDATKQMKPRVVVCGIRDGDPTHRRASYATFDPERILGVFPCGSARHGTMAACTGARQAADLLAVHQGEPGSIPGRVTPGFSHVGIVLTGFLGDLPFSPSFHSGAAPNSPQSPSSALKTSMLRAAQISSLTHSNRTCRFNSKGATKPRTLTTAKWRRWPARCRHKSFASQRAPGDLLAADGNPANMEPSAGCSSQSDTWLVPRASRTQSEKLHAHVKRITAPFRLYGVSTVLWRITGGGAAERESCTGRVSSRRMLLHKDQALWRLATAILSHVLLFEHNSLAIVHVHHRNSMQSHGEFSRKCRHLQTANELRDCRVIYAARHAGCYVNSSPCLTGNADRCAFVCLAGDAFSTEY
ncbi:hypothetical protein PR048_027158 [Dryococelus australis]|uniref:Uncharacterized protein n=1 Tax=Dryococelus australis TaxID=614101 RepID=A0ABQ9GF63_9NEOP|nr:hypothetical protein PR048_027158 [Dryococelus australis]